mgnify:FL=1
MDIEKKVISNLTLCYCVAPLRYKDKPHFLVASEKESSCLLFDEHGNEVDEIWKGPGGTMSAVQVPGTDGAFLATHRFYSPNNSKEASIVLCRPVDGGWKVTTVADLPYVHRFDILQRGGVTYLIACCIKSNYEYKDDWRFPGMTYACELPDDLLSKPEDYRLPLVLLKDNMLKNHGYSRDIHNGVQTGIVTCDTGVFRFTPPAERGGEWTIETLITDAASDAVMVDFDGDGEKELLTLSPFHGDTLRIYKKSGSGYAPVFEYAKKIEFAHAICGCTICGRNMAIIGYRKGERELLAVYYLNGEYVVEVLDRDVGPANVLHSVVDGKDILLSANREINEIAYYTVNSL